MTVTCVIAAWNEAARIAAVLDAVIGHPLVDQVIVVDDGSTDATAAVATAKGASVLVQTRNGGKSAAVARGLACAEGKFMLLLDADLIGLTADHVTALVAPVLKGRATASISLRQNAPRPWHWIGLDYISGERVMPRSLLTGHVDHIAALPRFGLEVFLNDLWIAARLRLKVIHLPGVTSPTKSRKQGLVAGAVADLAMLGDIFRTVPPLKVLRQILRLRQMAWPVMELSSEFRISVTDSA